MLRMLDRRYVEELVISCLFSCIFIETCKNIKKTTALRVEVFSGIYDGENYSDSFSVN